MSRTHRLFEITQYLRNRKLTTAQQLAEWLEVSSRTIYRDIQQLMLSGVPVNGEAGAGYWLEDSFDFPPLMFNKEELQALSIGMQLAIKCTDPRLAEAAESVLEKVRAQLPASLSAELEQSPLAMHFPLYPKAVREQMEIMRKAIKSQHKLMINYVDEKGESSQRIVRPLELSFWGKSWTLGSWCELRQGFRNFRPDRMVNVHRSQHKFLAETGKTLEDYYKTMPEH